MQEELPIQREARKRYDEQVFARIGKFGEDLLLEFPEIEGVAIIPSWIIPQEHLPTGIVLGRGGPLRTPVENMHMAMQLHAALRQQLDNIVKVMSAINSEAGRFSQMLKELDEQITQRKQTLHELNTAIASARRESGERD